MPPQQQTVAAVDDLFTEDGPLQVQLLSLRTAPGGGLIKAPPPSSSSSANKLKAVVAPAPSHARLLPPKPLLVAVPKQHGEYPLVLFFHGFCLMNQHYTQLLLHVASHGFIVVAPQLYFVAGADASQEIADAAAVIDWLPQGLASSFPSSLSSVKPNFQKLALVGHSRGGKVAFGLALGLCKMSLRFCAIAGLDPVDGKDVGQQTTPPVLKFSKHSFALDCPTLIIGAGLGSLKRNSLFPPCAPEGVNHKAFFHDSSAPAFYFVASEHGHMDFLDDKTTGFRGKLSYCTCRNGPSRSPMRRFAGGTLVAFFRAAMFRNTTALHHILVDPSRVPVKLDPPECYTTSTTPNSETPDLATVFKW